MVQAINVNFVGNANFRQVQSQLKALQAQMVAVNAEAARISAPIGGNIVNPQGYKDSISVLRDMRREFNNSVASAGDFTVTQHRAVSATEQLTERIVKQKASLSEMRGLLSDNARGYKQLMAQQAQMRKSVVQTWGTDSQGRMIADVVTPKMSGNVADFNKNILTSGERIGILSDMAKSAGIQMGNFGKNMQWTGRQISMGLTLPILAFGAVSGKLAYDVDMQMTRIKKVYDTTAQDVKGRAEELADVQVAAYKTAGEAAAEYGQSMNDTLDVQAELAAVGVKGKDLQEQTLNVLRASTLGELDRQTSLQATIAMQNVFNQSAKETGDAFNYINSVENATSLSTKDFAEAIPIAAAPVKALGGNLQDLGTLLVAMKSQGIAATQGANAIKGSLGRLVAPSKRAEEAFKAITGQDYDAILQRTGGRMIETFQAIDAATKDLDQVQKAKVFDPLFGKYQYTRMTAMMTGLRDINDDYTQVGRAANIAGQSTSQWAKTADKEIDALQESASFKVKAAFETLKYELAGIGEAFLGPAAAILNGFTKIAGAINGLPDIGKTALLWGAGLSALIGPGIMLVGLFAQLGGAGLQAFSKLGKLLGVSKLYTKEQWNAKIVSEQVNEAFNKETASTKRLADVIEASHARAAQVMLDYQATAAKRAASVANGYALERREIEMTMLAQKRAHDQNQIIFAQSTAAQKTKDSLTKRNLETDQILANYGAQHQARRKNGELKEVGKFDPIGKMTGLNPETRRSTQERAAIAEIQAAEQRDKRRRQGYNRRVVDLERQLSNERLAEEQKIQQAYTSKTIANNAKMEAEIARSQKAMPIVGNAQAKRNQATAISAVPTSMPVGIPIRQAADDAERLEDGVKKSTGRMAEFGSTAAVAGGSLAVMLGIQNEWVDKIMSGVFAMSLLAPVVGGIGKKVKSIDIGGMFKRGGTEAGKMGSVGTRALSGLKTLAASSAVQFGLLGAAIAAVGYGMYKLYTYTSDAAKAQDELADGQKKLASLGGYTYQSVAKQAEKSGDAITANATAMDKFRKEFPKLSEEMSKMDSSEVYDQALQIAIDSKRTGANAQQALKNAKVAIDATVQNWSEKQRLKTKLATDVIFLTDESQIRTQVEMMQRKTERIAEGEMKKTKTERLRDFFFADNVFTSQGGLSDEAKASLRKTGKDAYQTLLDPNSSAEAKQKFVRELDATFRGDILRAKNAGDSGKAKNLEQQYAEVRKSIASNANLSKEWAMNTATVADMMSRINGLSTVPNAREAYAKRIKDLQDGLNASRTTGGRPNSASVPGFAVPTEALSANKKLTDYQKLRILNEYRAQAGLKKTSDLTLVGVNSAKAFSTEVAEWNPNMLTASSTAEEIETYIANASKNAATLSGDLSKLGGISIGSWKSADVLNTYRQAQEAGTQELDAAANEEFDRQQDAAMASIEERGEARLDAYDKRREAGAERIEARVDRVAKLYDKRLEAIDLEKDAIDKQIDKEKEQEDLRKKMFDAEKARIAYLAAQANRNIDFNLALDSGKLDEAARIQNDSMAAEQTWVIDQNGEALSSESEGRVKKLEGKKTALDDKKTKLQKEKDDEVARQKEMADAEKKRYDEVTKARRAQLEKQINNDKAAEQRRWEVKKASIAREAAAVLAATPRNAKEANKQVAALTGIYNKYGINVSRAASGWSKRMEDAVYNAMKAGAARTGNDQAWGQMSDKIVGSMLKKTLGISRTDYLKWMSTGVFPTTSAANSAGLTPKKLESYIKKQGTAVRGQDIIANHGGGIVGQAKHDRTGFSGGISSQEQLILAQKGERITPKGAAIKNKGILDRIGKGEKIEVQEDYNDREGLGAGPVGSSLLADSAMSSFFATTVAQSVAQSMQQQMLQGAITALQAQAAGGAVGTIGSAKPGVYGDDGMKFNQDQLNNAAIISNVGRNMGMSNRDIIIGLMTAMQESTLRNLNYGDRDSLGLFQQRPSQGWGTKAQVRNPQYASKKFFNALKGVKGRDSMPMTQAAQRVQRSAYPNAYAKWSDEAKAIFTALQASGGTAGTSFTMPAPGGGAAQPAGRAAINWASNRLGDGGWLAKCQKFVRMAFGAPGGFGSAIAAWNGAKGRHKMSSGSQAPAGVPVYWSGGRYGHVALSTGGGRMISTDYPTSNRVGTGSIDDLTRKWGKNLLGWTEDINGKKIYKVPQLRVGADIKEDNTLANLHKDERVLTAPLTAKLDRGLERLDRGEVNGYHDNSVTNIRVDNAGRDFNETNMKRLAREITEQQRMEKQRTHKNKKIGEN